MVLFVLVGVKSLVGDPLEQTVLAVQSPQHILVKVDLDEAVGPRDDHLQLGIFGT